MKPPLPEDEQARLAELRRLRILDTDPEPAFDRLTRIAAVLTGSETALISLVDSDRQWFKSRRGLDSAETARDVSFCAHALGNQEPLVVLDALKDERFADNPLVTGVPKIRFYAGAPLKRPGGSALGTLCVLDPRPRASFPRDESLVLSELASLATELMEQRLAARRNEAERLSREKQNAFHHELQEALRQAQNRFIGGTPSEMVFGEFLETLLTLTGSEAGSIEEALQDGDASPRDFRHVASVGDSSLFDVMRGAAWNGKPVHRPGSVVVPVMQGNFVVGIVALQGRDSGYPPELVEDLAPFLSSVAGLFVAARSRREGRQNAFKIRLRDRALAAITSAVTIVDPVPEGGAILYCNAAFEAMSGFSSAEVTGRRFGIMHGPETDLEAIRAISAAFRTGESLDVTLSDYRRDGPAFWHHLRLAPVRSEDGRVEYFVTVGDDVTRQISADIELRRAKEAAETNAQLTSRFLANMSHEIRTPMNGVIGMTDLLLHSPLSEEQRDYVETIRGSGDGLLTIINEILDFSRLDSGLLELENVEFELTKCIEGALGVVAPAAAKKSLDLEYLLDPGVPRIVSADSTRLRQVLLNLLGNAVKFTARGNVFLSVSGSRLEDNTWELHFAVRDTGIGIPQAKIEEIFKPFRQADNSSTRRYGGTGLGLAISKHLAGLMGGRMWVETEEGSGSVFHFTIRAEGRSDPESGPADLQRMTLRGCRVLVIDPNSNSQSVLAQHLRAWGMAASIYPSPQAAVSAAGPAGGQGSSARFDLAIVDNDQPGLQLDVLNEISGGAPVIVLCSLGRRDTGLAAQLKGLDSPRFRLHSKPIKPSYFCDTLIGFLAGESVVRLADNPPAAVSEASFAATHPFEVLVVEDNPVNRKLVLLLLSSLGYQADTANNGFEAVRAVQGRRYDVVFMDMHMPEMDGVEATRCILELCPEGQKPWIIALTANAMETDRAICLRAGMRDFVTKPVQTVDLRNALEKVPPSVRQQENQPPEHPATNSAPALQPAPLQQHDLPGQDIDADAGPGQPGLNDNLRDDRSRNDGIPDDDTWQIPEYMDRLFGEEPELAADLLQIFIEESGAQISGLEQAFAEGDTGRAQKLLHSLKGSASQMGGGSLASWCKSVETGMSGGGSASDMDLGTLKQLHRKLADRMEARLGALAGTESGGNGL